MEVEVRKYRYTDNWGVYEGGELLCVTVYKKGAMAVARRIAEPSPQVEQPPVADEEPPGWVSRMFETSDLPLFSGTPVPVRASAYDPQPVARQTRMGACPLCFDTGRTKASGDGLCLCEKGEALRRERSQN